MLFADQIVRTAEILKQRELAKQYELFHILYRFNSEFSFDCEFIKVTCFIHNLKLENTKVSKSLAKALRQKLVTCGCGHTAADLLLVFQIDGEFVF
jgi:hypothetical protein